METPAVSTVWTVPGHWSQTLTLWAMWVLTVWVPSLMMRRSVRTISMLLYLSLMRMTMIMLLQAYCQVVPVPVCLIWDTRVHLTWQGHEIAPTCPQSHLLGKLSSFNNNAFHASCIINGLLKFILERWFYCNNQHLPLSPVRLVRPVVTGRVRWVWLVRSTGDWASCWATETCPHLSWHHAIKHWPISLVTRSSVPETSKNTRWIYFMNLNTWHINIPPPCLMRFTLHTGL